MPVAVSPNSPRVLELDVIRGFAIIMVMGVHVPAYPIWSSHGGFGVDLFFVLSGFLISNLLFAEFRQRGDVRLSRFFVRRAFKLYPSFYLLLAATLVYCAVRGIAVSGRSLIGEAILWQNYIGSLWGHTWSLAVEEHFYVQLPLLLALLMKIGRGKADPFRSLVWVFVAVAAGCLGARYWNASIHPQYNHHVHYEYSHLRFDTLAFGVLIAYLHNFRQAFLEKLMNGPARMAISFGGVLCLVPILAHPTDDPFIYTTGFTLLYVAFGTIILIALYPDKKFPGKSQPGRLVRAIAKLGFYSYTIYLWHVPLAQVFATSPLPGMMNQYLVHALYFVTCVIVGVGIGKLVEMPVLKLRDRLFPRTATEASSRDRKTTEVPVSLASRKAAGA